MKFFVIILLFFTLLNADSDSKNHHYYSKDLTYLNLSQIQEKQMKKILKEYRKDRKKYRKQKEKISQLKQDEFLKEKFDEKKIRQINKKIYNLNINVEVNFLKQIHKILSKKQREKFVSYMNEWDSE